MNTNESILIFLLITAIIIILILISKIHKGIEDKMYRKFKDLENIVDPNVLKKTKQ